MSSEPKPPKAFKAFTEKYPRLAEAWDLIHEEGRDGPLDAKTARLIKLGVAIGALRQGAVHSGVRKARAMGVTAEELEQVVALAAGTLGMPSTVAAFCWVRDVIDDD
jgi:alkylhydroperoxidase/carboxymuconolactone decarboxylase family protein YurZ